ncbi:hypothetical protein [Pelagicoccus sp. SDUM812005]|uniref:hypothetical protein n=1 Tax=Pelagicoccus sp. SDUM812005 TaxID=3041257 RepID=UPI00280D9498|nr:hypothetical protein [Pelagicoccus sp. SDUM812005]MDQ8180185.1 hypothetical protein [Pelagicoccus sp. SDUM812005]
MGVQRAGPGIGAALPARFKWICLGWLLVAMAWGALLRWHALAPVAGLNYRFGLHTHSHIALLGWGVMGLYVLLAEQFVKAERIRSLRRLFCFLQLCLLGMLLSFPFQGYGAVSIVASTLFVFGTYLFSWWLYRDVGDEDINTRLMARSAAVFLALSSIGPYLVGYFKAKGLEAHPGYANSLYFYLHFLYNGFFVSAMLALLFRKANPERLKRLPRFELPLFLTGVSVSYFLSVLWMGPHPLYYSLGAASAALQLMILLRWTRALGLFGTRQLSMGIKFVVALLVAKMSIQLVSAFPEIANWVFVTQIYTIIGYIHFVMLGIMTPFLFLSLFPEAASRQWSRWGGVLYFAGFLLTEALLFGAGLWSEVRSALPYRELLVAGYGVLIAGALAVALGARKQAAA